VNNTAQALSASRRKVFTSILNAVIARQTSPDSVMITIFLKHRQDKNPDSIQATEKKNKFGDMFPPKDARVVSWYVMMGIGQVVTVKILASELWALNIAIEKGAWGAFNTEFYPAYDYLPVWKEEKAKAKQK
jgi:hypothetical protein